jgi:hypothetical protein
LDLASAVVKMGIDGEKIDVADGPLDGAKGVATDSDGGVNDSEITCPAHTTERRLMWNIDLHVVPFLCIMYLLAFLGKLNADPIIAVSISS